MSRGCDWAQAPQGEPSRDPAEGGWQRCACAWAAGAAWSYEPWHSRRGPARTRVPPSAPGYGAHFRHGADSENNSGQITPAAISPCPSRARRRDHPRPSRHAPASSATQRPCPGARLSPRPPHARLQPAAQGATPLPPPGGAGVAARGAAPPYGSATAARCAGAVKRGAAAPRVPVPAWGSGGPGGSWFAA